MKVTKQKLKQLIREEYQAIFEDEDDDIERARELARDRTSGADVERGEYEEAAQDLPREWPRSPPDLQDPLSNLPGPKDIADHLYRIKKLIDELPIDAMEKVKYLNKILNDALRGDGN